MEQNLISSKGTFLLDKDEKLSLEQKRLIEKIITFSQENISSDKTSILVIEGDAGTGKSLILQQAFTKIQQIAEEDRQSPLYRTKNFLLVNHAEMLKIYRK
ncbi:DNA/RNA helicase domain-containing protein, partial [Oenococcus oeni]